MLKGSVGVLLRNLSVGQNWKLNNSTQSSPERRVKAPGFGGFSSGGGRPGDKKMLNVVAGILTLAVVNAND